MKNLYGGIEAGGTKFVCVVGSALDDIVAETRFPTTTPDETIQRAIDFFLPFVGRGELAGVGIGAFGPVDLNPESPTYGYITTTPKPHWQQTDLQGKIQRALNVPVAFDTDVNVAAFGEHTWTAENRSLNPLIYMTIGTGIGVGVFVNGAPIHGLAHTEAGHIYLRHNWDEDSFPGVCPFHGDCFEGLASGPAMNERWGERAEFLPEDHPAWDLEAEYIAFALVNLIYTYSPQRIILGGGVSEHAGLHDAVRRKVIEYNSGYIQSVMLNEKIDSYIVPPTLGNRSGSLGAIALAMDLVARQS